MMAHILTLALVALLTVPAAAVTRQADTEEIVWGDVAVEAKGKKHKKKDKSDGPRFTTVTRTVRQPVTQTFSNTTPIAIPGAGTVGIANPYPSAINIAGFANGVITDVNLTLKSYSHTSAGDVDVLLVLAQLPGLNALVMSDACGSTDEVGKTLTLDDQAATALPDNGPCVSGTFRPFNDGGSETFPLPAPPPSGNSLLGVFNNVNPNGSWQLFVRDEYNLDSGQFAGGWELQITAEADVQVEEQVPISKNKKDKKKGKGRH